jgi:hypothetical protein
MSQGSVPLGGDWHVRGNSWEAVTVLEKKLFFFDF